MDPLAERDYEPVQPRGTDWRALLRRITAPIVVVFGLLLKLGALAKFAFVFVAFGGYALIWGWKFAIGVIVLLFCHEMGHWIEAKREGLNPSWPVFIPFLGAYVQYTRGNPWQTARVAIAGPILGGVSALAFYLAGRSDHSGLLLALGYFGFFINLINLLPIAMLDGGAMWRSTRWLWLGGGREKATIAAVLFAGTAILLALGAWASYFPQSRL
ncbi:MAG TPA: site-2 protease family protein [Gaiellaceae bacterium]